jgi:hypothetical protein
MRIHTPILTNTFPFLQTPGSFTVAQQPSGRWAVHDAAGVVISEHDSNSRAWRAADKLANDPINKREDAAAWSFRKSAGGE